ncbi:DUF1761 domain-containing protein [Candidatus Saccharibacteria bacterium]|nr:DUF1761 domain-containing protein [Candidatus Saccharibacteria bacterium]
MDVEINVWAVLAATVASFIVGMVWYAPQVFGERWRKLIKMDAKTMKKGPGTQAWVLTVVGALLQAFVLAHVTYLSSSFFTDYSWMGAALSSAFWMWLGFQLSMILTHDSFEQRPMALTVLTAGNQLATLLAMGLVIGWLGL